MIEKAVLEELYINQKLSMSEIAKRLGVSEHKVVWWMSKYSILRRSRSEATYVKHNVNGDPFCIKTELTPDERFLLGVGLGLFWGEGNKANKIAIRIGNSDPRLLRVFAKFLLEIGGVKREKIRFWLQIFGDIDQEEALQYWEKELGFSRMHFLPSVIVSPSQGKGTYKKKSKYGVVTLFVSNKKMRDWLEDELQLLYNLPT